MSREDEVCLLLNTGVAGVAILILLGQFVMIFGFGMALGCVDRAFRKRRSGLR